MPYAFLWACVVLLIAMMFFGWLIDDENTMRRCEQHHLREVCEDALK